MLLQEVDDDLGVIWREIDRRLVGFRLEEPKGDIYEQRHGSRIALHGLSVEGFDESPLLGDSTPRPLNGDAYPLGKLFCQICPESARSFGAPPRMARLALAKLRGFGRAFVSDLVIVRHSRPLKTGVGDHRRRSGGSRMVLFRLGEAFAGAGMDRWLPGKDLPAADRGVDVQGIQFDCHGTAARL